MDVLGPTGNAVEHIEIELRITVLMQDLTYNDATNAKNESERERERERKREEHTHTYRG